MDDDDSSSEEEMGSGGFGGLLTAFSRHQARKEEIKKLKAMIEQLETEKRRLKELLASRT